MGTIRNPILSGFHPDPSILYHEGWFYVANSTFEWFGGVEIHRSKDLSVWESIARPLARRSQLDMKGNPESGGIWAPCLSYSDGLFWLIYTDTKTWAREPFKDTPNYLVTAEHIEGPWSEPSFLNCSGFDPSLFHDEDGRKWLVNMEWDYRQPGKKRFTGILLQEFRPLARTLTGPIKKIYTGTPIGLTEGPHLYKKDGWYYLVVAEGGTGYEHAVSVARSRSIDGPYETHPRNPLCSARFDDTLELRKAGHGSWCCGRDGRWFLVFLVGRPLPGTDRCVLGRETAIEELEWSDGWPYLKGRSEKELTKAQCCAPRAEIDVPWETKPFQREKKEYRFGTAAKRVAFLADFMTLRLPFDSGLYSLDTRPGYLRLYGRESPNSRHEQALIARRQRDFLFRAETTLDFACTSFQEMAGLTYRYDENKWYYLRISWDEAKQARTLGLLVCDSGKFSMPLGREEIVLPEDGPVTLGLVVDYTELRFYWSLPGGDRQEFPGTFDASILSDDYGSLGFTGAFVGMTCQDLRRRHVYADFSRFSYEGLEDAHPAGAVQRPASKR